MNSSIIFATITLTGMVILGFGHENWFSIPLLGITAISFFTTLFFSLKSSTQRRVLDRVVKLPFPERLTPVTWLIISIAMVGATALLAIGLEHFAFLGDIGMTLYLMVIAGIGSLITYWALVGTIRYFCRTE